MQRGVCQLGGWVDHLGKCLCLWLGRRRLARLCQVGEGLCQIGKGLCQVGVGLCQVGEGLCQVGSCLDCWGLQGRRLEMGMTHSCSWGWPLQGGVDQLGGWFGHLGKRLGRLGTRITRHLEKRLRDQKKGLHHWKRWLWHLEKQLERGGCEGGRRGRGGRQWGWHGLRAPC